MFILDEIVYSFFMQRQIAPGLGVATKVVERAVEYMLFAWLFT